MNILVFSQYFFPENFRVNTLCRTLVQRGHAVTVVTGYPQYPGGEIYAGYGYHIPYETTWNGVEVVRLKVKPRGKSPIGLLQNCFTYVSQGKKWVKQCQKKFDAVYVFEVSPVTVGLPAVAYKQKFGTPIFLNVQDLWPENVEVILGIHNPFVLKIINRIVDKIYGASDTILCASKGFAAHIAKRGVPKTKLRFWPQFCEEPNFEKDEKPAIYQADTTNIVFTGNIGDAQGLGLLVAAAEKLKNERVQWYLVGDGRACKSLAEQVRAKNLEQCVHFVGRVPEQEANLYIKYADCAYLSFQNNVLFHMTLPAKLQSYLACGTPILAAAGGETQQVISESKSGICVPQNVDKLVEAVQAFLCLSPNERAQMGKNGKQYFMQNFTTEKLVGQLEELMLEAQTIQK